MNNSVNEIQMKAMNGMPILILNILLSIAAVVLIIFTAINWPNHAVATIVACVIYLVVVMPLLFAGIKILKPQEALVLTLFGPYVGTLKGPGIFFVNPFCTSFKPPKVDPSSATGSAAITTTEISVDFSALSNKISLKEKTLNNDKQKINDLLGNPVIIDTAVIWQITDTAKAVFNVDNYKEYLSIQCDSCLRNIITQYPYDIPKGEEGEKSLRGSSSEIAEKLKEEIQRKVEHAGLKIIEARITNLSYAPEIAAAMLQRQQAAAVVDAKQLIVEGAVGIVETALTRLNEKNVVNLDEERKAAMVSNLLVVLCSSTDAQPVINSGSLY